MRERSASSPAGDPVKRVQKSSRSIDTKAPSRRPSTCAVGQNARRWCAGSPAGDEAERSRTIDEVHVHGTVATAIMTLDHGEVVFTDMFVLLCVDGEWRISNKVFHRH